MTVIQIEIAEPTIDIGDIIILRSVDRYMTSMEFLYRHHKKDLSVCLSVILSIEQTVLPIETTNLEYALFQQFNS